MVDETESGCISELTPHQGGSCKSGFDPRPGHTGDFKGAELQKIDIIVNVLKLFKSCLEILES